MLEIGEIIDNKYRILYEVGHGGRKRVGGKRSPEERKA